MLTKRQKNEQYLSMFTFFFGLLILMTLFIPSLKIGTYTFMGLDIVFGTTIYRADDLISLPFSWFNFFAYFLPIFAGVFLVLFDRFLYHESKVKLFVSVLPSFLYIAGLVLLFMIPSTTVLIENTVELPLESSFYVGPFFALGFMIAGTITSLLYFWQEGKIHRLL